MSSRRISKVNEAVRECVAMEILCKLRDPRVKNVTVLRAETAPDMRTAKVYVTVLGDEKVQALTMHGLRAAKGYLQSQLADRLQTRYTPVLTFVLDPSVKKSIEASRLIREALASGVQPSEGDAALDQDEQELVAAESVDAEMVEDEQAEEAQDRAAETDVGAAVVEPEASSSGAEDQEGAAESVRNTG